MTDQLGKTTSLVWNASGYRIAAIDPQGNRTSYSYNGNGQLVSVQNPLGQIVTQVYNATGQRIALINPLGAADELHVQRQRPGADRRRTRWATIATYLRDQVNRLTSYIDPLGNITSYQYDANSRLVQTINPLGATWTTRLRPERPRDARSPTRWATWPRYGYDAAGNLVARDQPVGRDLDERLRRREPADRERSTRWATGRATATTRPANRVSQTDPLGNNRRTGVYDNQGRLIASGRPAGQPDDVRIQRGEPAVSVTNPVPATSDDRVRLLAAGWSRGSIRWGIDDHATTRRGTGWRRPTPSARPGRRSTTTPAGGSASVDPLGNRTSLGYDASNRRVSTIDPLGNMWTSGLRRGQSIDREGRSRWANQHHRLRRGRAAGRHDQRHGRLTHERLRRSDRLIATVDPLGNRTSYGFDTANRWVSRPTRWGTSVRACTMPRTAGLHPSTR